jgi:hypothetical protein
MSNSILEQVSKYQENYIENQIKESWERAFSPDYKFGLDEKGKPYLKLCDCENCARRRREEKIYG